MQYAYNRYTSIGLIVSRNLDMMSVSIKLCVVLLLVVAGLSTRSQHTVPSYRLGQDRIPFADGRYYFEPVKSFKTLLLEDVKEATFMTHATSDTNYFWPFLTY